MLRLIKSKIEVAGRFSEKPGSIDAGTIKEKRKEAEILMEIDSTIFMIVLRT